MSESAQQHPSPYLRTLRGRLALSSRELAAAAEVSQGTVLNAEHGRYVPSPARQLRIVGALDRAFLKLAHELSVLDPPRLGRLDVWPRDEDVERAAAKVALLLERTRDALVDGEAVA
jgi:transcriptional regulator with XRE-family HTH domain